MQIKLQKQFILFAIVSIGIFLFSISNGGFQNIWEYVLFVTIFCIAFIDIKILKIPNWSLFVLMLIYVISHWKNLNYFAPLKSFIILICLYIIAEIYSKLRGKTGLGMGDIKLFSVLSLWLSFENTLNLITYSALFTIFAIIILKHNPKNRVAMAPYIVIAFNAVYF